MPMFGRVNVHRALTKLCSTVKSGPSGPRESATKAVRGAEALLFHSCANDTTSDTDQLCSGCAHVYARCVRISIALITLNEEANLPHTLESVMRLVREGNGEIIVVDSGSTDRTVEIARTFGAKVFIEPW